MQRNVGIEIETVDKSRGLIGTLWLRGTRTLPLFRMGRQRFIRILWICCPGQDGCTLLRCVLCCPVFELLLILFVSFSQAEAKAKWLNVSTEQLLAVDNLSDPFLCSLGIPMFRFGKITTKRRRRQLSLCKKAVPPHSELPVMFGRKKGWYILYKYWTRQVSPFRIHS